jgi:TRAP-type transport system periplasmic protein
MKNLTSRLSKLVSTRVLMSAASKAAIALAAAGIVAASSNGAAAQEKPLITKWLDGEVKAKFPAVTYDGPPITLKYSSFIVSGTPYAQLFTRAFKRLEEATNGKIVVRTFWGSTLSNTQRGAFEAIGGGVADFGNCYTMFNPGGFTLHHGLAMPFMFDTSVQSSTVAQELYVKYLKPEYEAKNVYLVRVATTRPNKVLTKYPVNKLEDIKGKKIWAAGAFQAQFAEALGAIPTNVQTSELYSAFQSGVLDVALMHDAGSRLFRLMELAKNRNDVNLWVNATEYCMNKTAYDKLPSDLKAIFYHWAQLWNQVDAQLYYDKEADEALADMNKRGVVSNSLSPDELKRWQAAAQPVIDKWVAEYDQKGVPAKQFVADMKSLAEKYGKMTSDQVTQQLLDKPIEGVVSN